MYFLFHAYAFHAMKSKILKFEYLNKILKMQIYQEQKKLLKWNKHFS